MNWFYGLAFTAAAGLVPAAMTGRDDSSPNFELRIEDRLPVKYRLLNRHITLGYLDSSGEFHRDPKQGTGYPGGAGINDARPFGIGGQFATSPEPAYEFRSGTLTPGHLLPNGRFAPTVGAKVISVDDYAPADDKPRIYNLPGQFEKLKPGQKRKPYNHQVHVMELKAKLAAAEAALAGQDGPRFEFRKDVERKVGLLRGKEVFLGRLNEKGTFAQDRDLVPIPYVEQSVITTRNPDEEYPVINHPRSDWEQVFEYRSGYLTAGNLTKEGEFVPAPGAIVFQLLPFGSKPEYEYSESEPRIYNLPGKFIKK